MYTAYLLEGDFIMSSINNFITHRKSFFKHTYFRKIVIFFICTLCAIFFIFSLLITFVINNNYKNEVIKINEESLKQFDTISQNVIGDIIQYTHANYTNNAELISLMYSDNFSTLSSIQSNNLMSDLSSYSSLITSFYIINFKGNYVCSNYGTYQNASTFFDADIINFLSNTKPSSSTIMLKPRTVNGTLPDGRTIDEKFLSIIYNSTAAGSFVVNINQDAYMNFLGVTNNTSLVENIIINRYGETVYHYEQNMFGSDFNEDDLYQKILDYPSYHGTFTEHYNNTNYYVSFYRNTNTGLTFIKLTKNLMLYTTNSLLTKTALFSFIFLIFCFIICLILSFILYEPIEELKSNLSTYSSTKFRNGNEFDQISQLYLNMYTKNRELKKDIKTYKSVSKPQVIRQLLDSSFASISPILNNLSELELSLEGPNYIVFLIGIDQNNTTYPKENYSLVLFSIYNVISELFEPYYLMEGAELNSTQLICILNITNTNKALHYQLLRQAQDVIYELFNITFSCGIGTLVNELESVTTSYKSALAALNYRFITGANSINTYESIQISKDKEQLYPYKVEKNILDAIKRIQPSNFNIYINEFFDIIAGYSNNRIILYILQLNTSIKQLELQCNLEISDYMEVTELSFQFNTLDSLKKLFIRRVETIIESLSEIRSNNPEKINVINEVIELIDQNIYDCNLSVESLAHQVHLSVNYLRSIFKESMGQSLSNYIIEQKLNLIYKLLIETDMSIQSISDKVGFTTRNYFFTFFKKHTGYTPNQYRKEHTKGCCTTN